MLFQVHEDALWILENLGIGCHNPEIFEMFKKYEADEQVIIYENRIYLTTELVKRCLSQVPSIDTFFVPKNSFFIGGTAPFVYDDKFCKGGLRPSSGHVIRIAKTAQNSAIVTGMGRGVKLKSEVLQMGLMAEYCKKPLYFAVSSDDALQRANEIYEHRKNIMIVFCLTRPPLEVSENIGGFFVKTAKAGLPLFISAMPMAGVSAPYCYSGLLTITHAEVLFGICLAQLISPGIQCVHAGFPTIADPALEYNPNYGLISHNLVNILMSHLNMMLDMPTCQSAGTTHEEHLTSRSLEDAKNGQALCLKYGFHMMRHPFAFLRYLIDFSFDKLHQAIAIADNVRSQDAPEVIMPVYDERGMESIRRSGLKMFMDDPLTTANIGNVFNI